MSPHVVLVAVEIKPETRDEFLRAIRIDAEGSRTEPQCLQFDVLEDKSNPNKFRFYEVYENDKSAIDFHRAQPHFKAWSDFKEKYGIVSQTVEKLDGVMFTHASTGTISLGTSAALVAAFAFGVCTALRLLK
eukprot:TRINITY_DN20962_c0_g1_i1.p1 TRINITY_DN20962_c0_g1~~TRINITY_DN20962_c0_g1_i1.p1  ORF type:complete len:132 (-),score=20.10 TRINITY_DN20962_c0_g1_i1:26-421(-)